MKDKKEEQPLKPKSSAPPAEIDDISSVGVQRQLFIPDNDN